MIGQSISNLSQVLHGGRPKDEEPHVKITVKKNKKKIEYITRVNLEELGITTDEFDDLQALFMLFDYDRDGILSFKESQVLLRQLGFRPSEEQAKSMLSAVSADTTGFSVSFNEYFTLISLQRRAAPDESSLLDVFLSFDPENTGKIREDQFRKVMGGKSEVSETDVEEMLAEYRNLDAVKDMECNGETEQEKYIHYKEFIAMLRQ